MGTPFLNKIIIFAILLTLGNPVQAFIIDRGNYLTDTKSGLDWLDVTLTVNLPPLHIISPETVPSDEFTGWRYATDIQLAELISNYTGVDVLLYDPFIQEPDRIDGLIELLGDTAREYYLHNFGKTYGELSGLGEGIYSFTLGYLVSGGLYKMAWLANMDQISFDVDPRYSDFSWIGFGNGGNYAGNYDIGHFLIRDSIHIPEPIPLFLLMGFALYLILRRFYVLPNTINNRRVRYTSSRDHGHSVKRL